MFQWIVAILAVGALAIVFLGDRFTSKSKSSSFYQNAKMPSGKEARFAEIPDPSTHDDFYTKLNVR
ncbi:MAG: hypothetical protein GX958_10760 [Desulfitobacterium sp.]|nr:hypothetical protein [Desulfitobacterium sp.]